MKYSLPPPQQWDDFQELTEAVGKCLFEKSTVHIYGREGQCQKGIDVYIEQERIGIQAKNRRLYISNGELKPNGQISIDDIKDILKEASKFKPTLSKLIVATTMLTDKNLQDEVIALNRLRIKASHFPVEFWFWNDFQRDINNERKLLNLYYDKILPTIPGFDPDALLLVTVSDAFHRPAIVTPARCENFGDDFLQALKDVQEALAIGVLKDRETRHIRSKAIYGYPAAKDPIIRQNLELAWKALHEARNVFTKGLSTYTPDGFLEIEQQKNFIIIRDRDIEHQLNEFRRIAIEHVNVALKQKGIAPILEGN